MKILLINQAAKNHGDEAACMALVRTLYNSGFTDLIISYNNNSSWNEKCFIKYKDVKQIWPSILNPIERRVVKVYLMFPTLITKSMLLLFPKLNREYRSIQKADFIISSPGGPNIGKYKDLLYLWRIFMAYKLGKSYAIYSPSIGPFDNCEKYYLKVVNKVLNNASFFSLRDQKSYLYAKDLGVNFNRAIDSAFLESCNVTIPNEIMDILPSKYVVVVPHELYKWHRDFKDFNKADFEFFFLAVINTFTQNGQKVVLLPQIYESWLNDEAYFQELKADNNDVVVIPTKYNSDIQQKIISEAEFVVGARYHTIVFAINNQTPFFCLSYEHKMIDMLKIIGLKNHSIDIENAIKSPKETVGKIYSHYLLREEMKEQLYLANTTAKKLATECFNSFFEKLNE